MSHEISLAVWDLLSPVIAGHRAKLKVGVTCPDGCNLCGTVVDIYNDTGERIGGGMLGSTAWPATTALYWAEVDFVASEREGDQSLRIYAWPGPPHPETTSVVTVVVSRPPEHHVTVYVADQSTGRPVSGVELRLGRFRTTTNEEGIAEVEVPGGSCDVGTWKNGYEVLSRTIDITGDATIRLELAAAPEPEQPYWM